MAVTVISRVYTCSVTLGPPPPVVMPVALGDSVGDAEERAVRMGSLEGVGRFLGSLSLWVTVAML